MERLNLNIPGDVRKVLKLLAKKARRREGELARELFVKAVAAAAREELLARVAATQTPALRERELAIAAALEGVDG
jgi:hypothetical protein